MSVGIIQRQRRAARQGRLRAPATTFVLRTVPSVQQDTRVTYPLLMADRPIDRQAWAALVQQLVDEEAKGNKSEFGRMVKVTFQTVTRWLKAENDVKEESVRSVARALNLRPMDLLVQVGYYDQGDLSTDGELIAPSKDASDDEAIAAITDAPLTPAVKRELKKWLADRRAEDARRRLADLRALLERETRRTA